jgi:hypothetical protein
MEQLPECGVRAPVVRPELQALRQRLHGFVPAPELLRPRRAARARQGRNLREPMALAPRVLKHL